MISSRDHLANSSSGCGGGRRVIPLGRSQLLAQWFAPQARAVARSGAAGPGTPGSRSLGQFDEHLEGEIRVHLLVDVEVGHREVEQAFLDPYGHGQARGHVAGQGLQDAGPERNGTAACLCTDRGLPR